MSQTSSPKQKDPAKRGQWKVELEQRLVGVEVIVAEGASVSAQAQGEQGQIQHRIGDYEKRIIELRDTLAKTTAALGVTTNDLQCTRTELQRHTIHIDNLRNGLIQLETQHQVLKLQHASLVRQRDEAEIQARRYRRLLAEYKQLVEDADQFRQDVRREMKETEERWQQKMATVTHELGALKAQSDTREQETAALACERDALKRQLREKRMQSVQTQTQPEPPAVASAALDGNATASQRSPPLQQPTPRATPKNVARPLKVDGPPKASATNVNGHTDAVLSAQDAARGTATQSTTFSQMPMCNPPTKSPAPEDPRIEVINDPNDEHGKKNAPSDLDGAPMHTASPEKSRAQASGTPSKASGTPSKASGTPSMATHRKASPNATTIPPKTETAPAPAMDSEHGDPVHTPVEAFVEPEVTPAVTTINYDGDDEQSPAQVPDPSPAHVNEPSPIRVSEPSPAHIPDAASTAFSYADLTRSPVPMAPPEPPEDDPWTTHMYDYHEEMKAGERKK
uniref:Uncharacterized protein n=1 Tax=Schizophyllum commune (strain H4-8 / FGSC 9210) TaxID=578458 RepID=D8PMW6_SCHCM